MQAAAGRALGLQKSKLSRRILRAGERRGVRPLNGSSRRFSGGRSVAGPTASFTTAGVAMLVEAEAAEQVIAEVRGASSSRVFSGIDAHPVCLGLPPREARVAAQMVQAIAVGGR